MENNNRKTRAGRLLRAVKNITLEEIGRKAKQESDKSRTKGIIIDFIINSLIPHSLERFSSKLKSISDIVKS